MAIFKNGEMIGLYVVQSLIKENLYTETYRVEDEDNNPYFMKAFVLKKMPEKLVNPETGKVLEIEYCKNMKHKNIVSYLDCGEMDTEEGAVQYYLTNYFSGELLIEKIQREGKVVEEEALAIFRNVLEGLQYMHSQATALCHNDITPSNIVLNDAMNGEAVIIDLGHTCTPCAGIAEFDTTDLDVLYHAKETMVGIFDQQTDIFSACATLYAMLTGRAPWMIDVASEGDYKERFKAMWQYRQL